MRWSNGCLPAEGGTMRAITEIGRHQYHAKQVTERYNSDINPIELQNLWNTLEK